MTTFSDTDFNSAAYNAYRPTFKQNLYEKIYLFHKSHNGRFDTALDIGTGTGQVASELSNSFKQVYATDPSSTMLQNAIKKPNIVYFVGAAENLSQISSGSIDFVTVSQAAHWFNLTEFYKESYRVLKPHGTLAIWSYSYNVLKDYPDAEQLMKGIINDDDKLGPYWGKGVELLRNNNLYRELNLPEEKFQNVKREIYDGNSDNEPLLKVEWTLSQLEKYYKTWTAYKNYLAANPNLPDPIDKLITDLKQITGEDNKVLTVVFRTVLILAERKP